MRFIGASPLEKSAKDAEPALGMPSSGTVEMTAVPAGTPPPSSGCSTQEAAVTSEGLGVIACARASAGGGGAAWTLVDAVTAASATIARIALRMKCLSRRNRRAGAETPAGSLHRYEIGTKAQHVTIDTNRPEHERRAAAP